MVLLHLAGRERGRDYGPMIRFLWQALQPREESLTSPLMQDCFERRAWDQGPLSFTGERARAQLFWVFKTEAATGVSGRALHVGVELASLQDAAWFGYGLNWALKTRALQRD